MRAAVALVVVGMLAVIRPARADEPAAAAEETKACEPACRLGEACVNGTCMVPAQSARPAPPPANTPGYPPPGYPPPGYPYPPPAYGYPPPGYAPPGYAPPAPPRPPRRGFLALPYAGIHSFSGEGTSGLDPGLRLGAILGGNVSEAFSANGELTFDIVNPDEPAGGNVSEVMGHITFSPLFHAYTASAEIVLGPKLGAWALTGHVSSPYLTADFDQRGWTIGANAGVFFPLSGGSTSMGMLLSYANLQLTHSCVTISGYGEMCVEPAHGVDVFGLTVAALF
jgi:hypothetical protein